MEQMHKTRMEIQWEGEVETKWRRDQAAQKLFPKLLWYADTLNQERPKRFHPMLWMTRATMITRVCWVVCRPRLTKVQFGFHPILNPSLPPTSPQPLLPPHQHDNDNHPSSLKHQLASFQLFFVNCQSCCSFYSLLGQISSTKIEAWKIWICDWSFIWVSKKCWMWGTLCRQGCIWPAIYYPVWGPGPILILGQIHKFLRKFRKSQSLEHCKYLKEGKNKLFLLFSFSK